MSTILIIDDEEKLRKLLARIITLEGFEVIQAQDAKTAWKRLEQAEVDVILCDVKLPDTSGIELSKKIKAQYPATEIILLTAYGNIPDSVQAIKNGAFDYITKGDDNNKILPLVYRAGEKVQLAKRLLQLEKQVGQKYSFDNVIGQSANLKQAIELAKKVAHTDVPVLLLGETGTGKEVFAQAIHLESKRKNEHFVALNCAAFTKDLLESELFGYKAGAFTGALKDKKGLLEEAHKGTLFLDEMGEMPIDLQAKILRVLENGEVLKLGDVVPVKVDVRIIAATNRNLQEAMEKEQFRSDLYYRIAGFTIHLPSLRDRKQDISLLAQYFAQLFTIKLNRGILKLGTDYIQALENYHWKGNIRELKNVIERSVILTEGDRLGLESLPTDIRYLSSSQKNSCFAMQEVEKQHIQKVLQYTKGNKAEAARLLEIGIATLYRKIEEYNI
ncbi:sigma-54-dependent transcriptional regulator [Pedobacter sp.]|uniref:sigma-54-dependent transcriptional regulator n=1 Tax=Pedobacter sp. TaxID=1411316 RepID=UPI00396C649B